MAKQIPVGSSARQAFSVRLGDRTFRMQMVWHPLSESWCLSISSSGGTMLLAGIRLTAERRLLQGYRTDFAGDLFVAGIGDPGRRAWGETHQLVWLEPGE